MKVLSDETVKMAFKAASESLEKSGDLIISKQVIVAAFAEIIETRKKNDLHSKNLIGIGPR